MSFLPSDMLQTISEGEKLGIFLSLNIDRPDKLPEKGRKELEGDTWRVDER
jgi:hypothetical protein